MDDQSQQDGHARVPAGAYRLPDGNFALTILVDKRCEKGHSDEHYKDLSAIAHHFEPFDIRRCSECLCYDTKNDVVERLAVDLKEANEEVNIVDIALDNEKAKSKAAVEGTKRPVLVPISQMAKGAIALVGELAKKMELNDDCFTNLKKIRDHLDEYEQKEDERREKEKNASPQIEPHGSGTSAPILEKLGKISSGPNMVYCGCGFGTSLMRVREEWRKKRDEKVENTVNEDNKDTVSAEENTNAGGNGGTKRGSVDDQVKNEVKRDRKNDEEMEEAVMEVEEEKIDNEVAKTERDEHNIEAIEPDEKESEERTNDVVN